jgi:hypothetical protein
VQVVSAPQVSEQTPALQIFPEPQAFPQVPQLALSVAVLAQ